MLSKLMFIAKWLIAYLSEILKDKITKAEEKIDKLNAIEKKGERWKVVYGSWDKHLSWLVFWLKATPVIVYVTYITLSLLLVIFVASRLLSFTISQILIMTTLIPLPVTIGIYMVFGTLLVFFIAAGIDKIRALFNIPLMETDYDAMYEQILETAYMAVDTVICNKVGLYSPQAPSILKPVSTEWEVVNNVAHFYVEFNKYKDMENADEELFKRLFEKNLKRLRKERKLPIAFTDRVGIRGRVYEPLLVMHTRQNVDSLIVAMAFADEDSVTMLINSQNRNRNGGELFDDE